MLFMQKRYRPYPDTCYLILIVSAESSLFLAESIGPMSEGPALITTERPDLGRDKSLLLK